VQNSSKQSAFRRTRRGGALLTAAVVSGCLLFPTAAQAATGAPVSGSDSSGAGSSAGTVSPTPAPTASSTAAKSATATPSPTKAPAATATPKPTATTTAKPTATPKPAATATATPKPAATATATVKATAAVTPAEKTWRLYRSAYSATVYELVNGTTPNPINKERWVNVYKMKTPMNTPTDYVRYAWSPTVYAQTYWPGGESARQWDQLTTEQWRTAGSPTARVMVGYIKGSTYYRWATSKQVFVKAPDGTAHALTSKELTAAGGRPIVSRSNEGFRKLAWAGDVVRFTDLAGGKGRAITKAEWVAEDYPAPQVLTSAPGESFHRAADDPTIWYTGLTINRPITTAEWEAAGKPEVTVTPGAGAPVLGDNPIGSLDQVTPQPGAVTVGGWTIDPNTASAILADVYVDGAYAKTLKADRSRPDVGGVYPNYGGAHGFSVVMNMSVGTHTVCVYGINTGPGSHLKLGCSTVAVPAPVFPTASVSSYSRTSSITFTNNTSAAIQWPFLTGVPLSDRFGPRPVICSVCLAVHNGLDFTPGMGSDIAAIAAGRVSKVVQSSGTSGFGTYVVIDHTIDGQKVQSVYAHMLVNSPIFSVGDTVKQGDRVGRVGSTGSSTGAHLHLEIVINGKQVDPYAWLTAHNQ
jgi:hypothetical protein